jgi:hypothetical protein
MPFRALFCRGGVGVVSACCLLLAHAAAAGTPPSILGEELEWQQIRDSVAGMAPVAATRCDRDGDGNRDLVVAFAGGERGELVWWRDLGDELGPAEPPQPLGYAPAALTAADFDGDGAPELMLARTGSEALVLADIDDAGKVSALSGLAVPAPVVRLESTDLQPRDGAADLLVELESGEWLVARGGIGGREELRGSSESAPVDVEPRHDAVLLRTRVDRDALSEVVAVADDGGLWIGFQRRATVVVTTTNDTFDLAGGQQVADLPGPDGLTTLREALIAVSNTPGPHTIEFDIPQAGNDFHDDRWWISPLEAGLGALPPLTRDGATIDGYTQTANQGDTNADGPEIVIDGSGVTSHGHGLEIEGESCALIDLEIRGFPGTGVVATEADNLIVHGCQLGPENGEHGAYVGGGTVGVEIGGPGTHGTSPAVSDGVTITDNDVNGLVVDGAGTGAMVRGNRIGRPLGNGSYGVWITGGAVGVTVGGTDPGEGNVISGNNEAGVQVDGAGTDATVILGNRIGTDADGLVAVSNVRGVVVAGGAMNTLIGGTVEPARNLISGNFWGVEVRGAATTGTRARGNWIGVDATGSAALPNEHGVDVVGGSDTVIGGSSDLGEGNVLSGNNTSGVNLSGGVTGVQVLGNMIGTDPSGTVAVGNGQAGVRVLSGASNNEIGGFGSGEGNLISGNQFYGVEVLDEGTQGNRIWCNTIGPGFGVSLAHEQLAGVLISLGADATEVGSSSCQNELRDNEIGVEVVDVGTEDTLIVGNHIHWNDIGVHVTGGAGPTTVGGSGSENMIAGSETAGVVVTETGTKCTIADNEIFNNPGLGIDLGNDGVTANDTGDGDDGPNALVNFPVLASALSDCATGQTTIEGAVDTSSPEQGLVRLFVSDYPESLGGYGEGATPLTTVVPAGDGSFSVTVAEQAAGTAVTATYTDSGGRTSEFSRAVLVDTTPRAPMSLQAAPASGPSVELTWTDAAATETGYRIERREDGVGDFALLGAVGAESEAYTDTSGVSSGTSYSYRVQAEGGACSSAWSNVAHAVLTGVADDLCRTMVTEHRDAGPIVLEYGGGSSAAVWRECHGDMCTLSYGELDATGQLVAGPEVLVEAVNIGVFRLVRGDGEWGLVWTEHLGLDWALMFQAFDPSGAVTTGPVRIDDEPLPSTHLLDLAWDGAGWGVVWRGLSRAQDLAGLWFTRLVKDGTIVAGPVRVDDSPGDPLYPRMVFDGVHYATVWMDVSQQIYFRRLALDGTPVASSVPVTEPSSLGRDLDIEWNGSEHAIAWNDARDGDWAVYLRLLDLDGTPVSSSQRLTDSTVSAYETDLDLCRLPSRWVVASSSARGVATEVWLAYADDGGSASGDNVLISTPEDGEGSELPAVLWNGTTLVTGWEDKGGSYSHEVHLQAADAAGDPGSYPRRIVTSGHQPAGGVARTLGLAHLPDGYALVWGSFADGDGYLDPFLTVVDSAGASISGEVQVGEGAEPWEAEALALDFSGELLGVVWKSDQDHEVYLSRFDATGSPAGADVMLVNGWVGDVWWTGEAFLTAVVEPCDNGLQVVTSLVAEDGSVLTELRRVTSADGTSRLPRLAGSGSGAAVVWQDDRNGFWEVFAAQLDRSGGRIGDVQSVAPLTGTAQQLPDVCANGSGHLAVWAEIVDGVSHVFARPLSVEAVPEASPVQLSSGKSFRPRCAWDGTAWHVVYMGYMASTVEDFGIIEVEVAVDGTAGAERFLMPTANRVNPPAVTHDGQRTVFATPTNQGGHSDVVLKSLPCALDPTPPSCATGLTGGHGASGVELSWTPGGDADFAVAWPMVHRDDTLIDVVTPTVAVWNDPAPPPGTYSYSVTTVNQGQVEASGCSDTGDVVVAAPCTGARALPIAYQPEDDVPVSISVSPPGSTATWAVEETPPAGWAVSGISDGGSWDGTHVKWIFFDAVARELAYTATPPSGTSGSQAFSGVLSIDGASQDLCGDLSLPAAGPHPADAGLDWEMGIDEVTAYGAAWRRGQGWPVPPVPIPISWVTNAAYLWTVGGPYHYDLTLEPPYAAGSGRHVKGAGTASASFGVMAYVPGEALTVVIDADPGNGTFAWAVEHAPPAGWPVSGISHSGEWDATNEMVKWGPFIDDTPRQLTYSVTPPGGSSGEHVFAGTASFDGDDLPIGGASAISDLAGDVNGSGSVSNRDLTALVADLFGRPAAIPDVDQSGAVDAGDVAVEVRLLSDGP